MKVRGISIISIFIIILTIISFANDESKKKTTPKFARKKSVTKKPRAISRRLSEQIKIRERAATLQKLIEKVKPDLYWKEDEGIFLLWAKKLDNGRWQFTMDCAYTHKSEGKPLECVLATPPSRWWEASGYVPRYTRAILSEKYSLRKGSGYDHVAHSDKYGDLFKIVYCELPYGINAPTKTFLVYRTNKGKWILAAKNFKGDERGKMGHTGYSYRTKINVKWTKPLRGVPFKVALIYNRWGYEPGEYEEGEIQIPDLRTYLEGKLYGQFPMKVKWESYKYAYAEKGQTLEDINKWYVYYELKPYVDEKNAIKAVYALNPGLPREKPLKKGQIVNLPATRKVDFMKREIRNILKRIKKRKSK